MSRTTITTSLLCLAVLGGPALAQDDDAPPSGGRPATAVRVGTVERQEHQERRRVTGELRAVSRSRVATREQGLILELPIDEGTRVKRGDVLAKLDDDRLEIQLRRIVAESAVAEAIVAMRVAEVELEERDLTTLTDMSRRSAVNPKELGDAETDVKIAAARRDGAARDLDVIKARADLLRRQIADMTITAPFDGVVIAVGAEVGEWVAEGDSIAEVVSTGAWDAWIDVPQRFAAALMGTRAHVQIQLDATGRLAPPATPTIVPVVDTTARSFPVFVRIDDPDGALAPGMSVTGWVPTGRVGEYLTMPRNALMRNEIGFYVYVARGRPEGPAVATPTSISVLFEVGSRVVVESDALEPGDRVVVEGNERLHPMMPITPIPVDAETASRTALDGTAAGGR